MTRVVTKCRIDPVVSFGLILTYRTGREGKGRKRGGYFAKPMSEFRVLRGR
jgi:hypothetical protein